MILRSIHYPLTTNLFDASLAIAVDSGRASLERGYAGLRLEATIDSAKALGDRLAQVNGRDELPVPDKVRLDRAYLERCGPGLDLEVLLRTALVLFTGRGVN